MPQSALQLQQHQQALQHQQQPQAQVTSAQRPQANGMGAPPLQGALGGQQQLQQQQQQQMTPAQQAQVAAMYGAMAGQQDANANMLQAYQVHLCLVLRTFFS